VVNRMEDERRGKKRPRYNGLGRACFLLNIEAIKADLKLGSRQWAYEETWKAKLKVSYSQFGRYIRDLIKDGKQIPEAPKISASPVPPVASHRPPLASSPHPVGAQAAPRQAPRLSATQFHFDPAEAYQRRDLI
jgi:hypothetical protein